MYRSVPQHQHVTQKKFKNYNYYLLPLYINPLPLLLLPHRPVTQSHRIKLFTHTHLLTYLPAHLADCKTAKPQTPATLSKFALPSCTLPYCKLTIDNIPIHLTSTVSTHASRFLPLPQEPAATPPDLPSPGPCTQKPPNTTCQNPPSPHIHASKQLITLFHLIPSPPSTHRPPRPLKSCLLLERKKEEKEELV